MHKANSIKKPFILLELLIALTLVAIFGLPLIRTPLNGFQQERRLLSALEIERLANARFVEIRADIYSGEIPWGAFDHKASKMPFASKEISINLPHLSKTTFEEKTFIYSSYSKKGDDDKEYRLVRMILHYVPKGSLEKEKPLIFSQYTFVAS